MNQQLLDIRNEIESTWGISERIWNRMTKKHKEDLYQEFYHEYPGIKYDRFLELIDKAFNL